MLMYTLLKTILPYVLFVVRRTVLRRRGGGRPGGGSGEAETAEGKVFASLQGEQENEGVNGQFATNFDFEQSASLA